MARTIDEVLEAHRDSLMAIEGVVGTAHGLCDGTPCIRVFLSGSTPTLLERIPERLDGHPVRTEVSGRIVPRDSGGDR